MMQKNLGNTNEKIKQRDSNIELFRIVAMILIVAHHYVIHNLILYPDVIQNSLSLKSLFYIFFGAWGKTAINCFVLITGYYMCKSQITLEKFLKLLFEIMFYKISIYFIFLFTGQQTFSLKYCLQDILPIFEFDKNFVGCYLVFFLLIPYLNILVKNMTEKLHRNLLYLLLFVFVVLGSIPYFNISFNYVTWFCVLYFISSYIRLYPKPIFENQKILLLIFTVSLLLAVLSIIGLNFVGQKINEYHPYFFIYDSNKIFAVILGITSFLLFKNMKIKYCPFINIVASTTFGIFLIHDYNYTMRNLLYKDIFNVFYCYNSQYFYLYAIVSVLLIFIICSFIDYLRIILIEKPTFNLLHKKNII